jgi:hypothetical protein
VAIGNAQWGIDLVDTGLSNAIGNGTVAGRNVIAGNSGNGGLAVNNANATTVRGNYVGLAADGSTVLGNGSGFSASWC